VPTNEIGPVHLTTAESVVRVTELPGFNGVGGKKGPRSPRCCVSVSNS